MTAPIEDVRSLPGRRVSDQQDVPIGEVREIYATDDGYPMWIAIEARNGIADRQTVFVPLARLKVEDGDLRVPYDKNHILDAPQVDAGDGISSEHDEELRAYYGIGAGDQELRSDNKSYATLVPDEAGAAQRVEDPGKLETPDPDRRTDETRERLHDPGTAEMRHVPVDEVVRGDSGDRGNSGDSDEDSGDSE